MTRTDTNSLYVLVCSLAATVISLPEFGTSPPRLTLLLAWLPKTSSGKTNP